MIYKNFYRLAIIILVCTLWSCARAPVKKPSIVVHPTARTTEVVHRHDIVHTVAPGETVWRLAKMYDVKLEDLMRVNKLKKPQDLRMGQRLLVPRAAPLTAFIPLYPSRKWRYIIVHHSATDQGDALAFHSAHSNRGFDRGLGYHFVIDNGTKGKPDGHIEVSPRWLKQQDGAHCKASNMNCKAIGICLVGNFSRDYVSARQMKSLVYLVNRLRKYYRISYRNILGHGQVRGAKTECPGKNFSMYDLKRQLRKTN